MFPLKQNQLSVQPRFLIHSNWISQAYRCNLIAEQPPLGSEDDTKFVGFSWRMMSKKLGGWKFIGKNNKFCVFCLLQFDMFVDFCWNHWWIKHGGSKSLQKKKILPNPCRPTVHEGWSMKLKTSLDPYHGPFCVCSTVEISPTTFFGRSTRKRCFPENLRGKIWCCTVFVVVKKPRGFAKKTTKRSGSCCEKPIPCIKEVAQKYSVTMGFKNRRVQLGQVKWPREKIYPGRLPPKLYVRHPGELFSGKKPWAPGRHPGKYLWMVWLDGMCWIGILGSSHTKPQDPMGFFQPKWVWRRKEIHRNFRSGSWNFWASPNSTVTFMGFLNIMI